MNRGQIRKYARGIVDEYTEEPEGLILDEDATDAETDLNDLINISQGNVQLDIIQDIPWYFRKPFLISIQANKRTYSIPTDFSISDFLMMENIFHNESGKKPQGLLYVEPDQIWEYTTVGKTDEPKVWSYEGKDTIAFDPTPSATIADRYKAYYFYELPDLTQDTATPDLPKCTHQLIAIDAARQYHLIGEEEAADIMKRYIERLSIIKSQLLSIKPSISSYRRPSLKEVLNR